MNVRQLWRVKGELDCGAQRDKLFVARDFDEATAFAPDALLAGWGSGIVREITSLQLVEDSVAVPPAGRIVHGDDLG